MKRLPRHLAASFLYAACLLLAACGDDSCQGNGSSLPLAVFYVGDTQQTIQQLSVMGIGVPGDSLLLSNASANEIYLPLRAGATATSFAFSRTLSSATFVQDTLTVRYQPITYFHSTECGAMYNFDIEHIDCTTHGIDSVVLITPLVTNATTPAMRIYFRQ